MLLTYNFHDCFPLFPAWFWCTVYRTPAGLLQLMLKQVLDLGDITDHASLLRVVLCQGVVELGCLTGLLGKQLCRV